MQTRIALLVATVCFAWLPLTETPAQAADWMFQRSYFSHAPGPGQSAAGRPQSRSAYREPFVGAHPRFAIRGGYRYNSIVINTGAGSDRTFIRENWFDANY